MIDLRVHKNQAKITASKAKHKVIHKGRRFGLTRYFERFSLDRAFAGDGPILWVDVINSNIDRYAERYFIPDIGDLQAAGCQWRQVKKELRVQDTWIDFRSADKPENIEGYGYKYVIVNEAGHVLKDRKLWQESLMPLILDFDGHFLVGGTPKGEMTNDGIHPFFELAQINDGKNWETFNFSTYDNPLIKKEVIDQFVQTIPEHVRDQEIFGRFIKHDQFAIFDLTRFMYYEDPPKFSYIVQAWDTAHTKTEHSSWSVCQTWGIAEKKAWLIDNYRAKLSYSQLKAKAESLYWRFNPRKILIENKASGISLIQDLMLSNFSSRIEPVNPDKDKEARAHTTENYIARGYVMLPKHAPWLQTFLDECRLFPQYDSDDQVDCMTMALSYIGPKLYRPAAEIILSAPYPYRERLAGYFNTEAV